MADFKEWLSSAEGMAGYVLAAIGGVLSEHFGLDEARREPDKLRNRTAPGEQGSLFAPSAMRTTSQHKADPRYRPEKEQKACPITPLSGFKKHIGELKAYAMSGPDQMAFTMMFSPLSANTPFSKHWDNFQVLKLILKHYFPRTVQPQDLIEVIDSFSHYLHSLGHTIAGWKINTVVEIWNNRESLFSEMKALGKAGDDEALVARLCRIPGVQPVKAGFIVQLLFGRAGCIDTHNIDIYSKVFPHMKDDLDPSQWDSAHPEGVKKYMKLLGDLDKHHGIGSQQLWDVWVDFVEHFYLVTSEHGLGSYAQMGSALDPNDPIYQAFANVKVPKTRVGVAGQQSKADIPMVSGKYGMGASATHLPSEPDEMLKQFHGMYNLGQRGSDAARAVPFHKDKLGRPLDRAVGMGTQPSALHYFGPAVKGTGNDLEVDPQHIRHIVDKLRQRGGKKKWAADYERNQGGLF
jgi:hypothetical protein